MFIQNMFTLYTNISILCIMVFYLERKRMVFYLERKGIVFYLKIKRMVFYFFLHNDLYDGKLCLLF